MHVGFEQPFPFTAMKMRGAQLMPAPPCQRPSHDPAYQQRDLNPEHAEDPEQPA